MAYEMQGITALDPRVSATEKFINENNIPPEQVPDFLMQMGADPKLAGLVFKYRRLQSAAGQQQNQPPASTVAQDVDQQYAQIQQGVASLPAPVMENAQFQGGIAPPQEEAPPQGMAGGGIVAFSRGGTSQLNESEMLDDISRLGYGSARAKLAALIRDAEASGQIERAAQLRLVQENLENKLLRPAGYLSEGARRSLGMEEAPTGIAAVAPDAASVEAPPQAAPDVAQSAGFLAPDTAGDAFDVAMRMARTGVAQDTAAPAAPSAAATPAAPRREAAPAAPAAPGIALPEVDKAQTLEQVEAARKAREKAAGIGDATKAYEDFLKARGEEVSQDKKLAYKNAWMLAGARLLGSRSPDFAQALGEAAEAGITGYQKDLKDIKAAEQALKKSGMDLAVSREAIARGDLRADEAEVRRQQDAYSARQLKLYELQTNARDKALDRAMDLRIAELRNVTGGDSRIARLQSLYDATQEEGITPQERQARQERLAAQLKADREFTAATTAGGYSADIRSGTQSAELLRKVRESSAYQRQQLIADNPNRPESEREAARQKMADLERDAAQGGPRVSSTGYAPTSPNLRNLPYSNLSDDDLMSQINSQFGIRG